MSSYEENMSKGLLVDGTIGPAMDIKTEFPGTKNTALPDMLASLPDVKPSVMSDLNNSEQLSNEKPMNEAVIQKLSMNLRKFCSIRLRLPQSLSEMDLNSLCVLNPEYQIKILEENLKYLQENKFKDKEDQFGSEVKQPLAISRPYTRINSEPPCAKDTFGNEDFSDKLSSSKDADVINTIQPRVMPPISRQVLNPRLANHSSFNIKDMKSENILFEKPKLYANPPMTTPLDNCCFKTLLNKSDNDNQFEFTLEQEKIVSFVCSPSPKRKQRFNSKNDEESLSLDSDFDSDKQSEMSSIKEDSSSDSVSYSSFKSSVKIDTFKAEHYIKWKQLPESNKLLWHPPLNNNGSKELARPHTGLPQSDVYRSWQPESYTNKSSTLKLEHSLRQEAILFRETSLRGCYNVENILRDEKLSPELGFDVKYVRDLIFSSIRFPPDHEDIIPDSVDSVLDIFRAWVKLNSHFESKGFKDVLLRYGIELSVVSDFLKWQSISRTFIDKIINALQKISSARNVSNPDNRQGSANLNKIEAHQSILSSCVGNLSNNPIESQNVCQFPKSELIQNKHWKQRRFMPNQPKASSEKKLYKQKSTSKMTNNSFQLPCFPKVTLNNLRPTDVGHAFHTSHENNGNKSTNCTGVFQNNANIDPNLFSNQFLHLNIPNKCTENGTSMKFNGIKANTDTVHLKKGDASKSVKNSNVPYENCSISSSVPFQNITLPNQRILSSNLDFGQTNISQHPTKLNPISCVENDHSEINLQCHYIKPGVYNPPQKLFAQTVKTKNITVEDTPVVGIPVLYWPNAENPTHQCKPKSKLGSIDNGCDGKCLDTWKAAVSLAESLRDNYLINTISESSPKVKLSETISFKTHFLLSDEATKNRSSILNGNSEDATLEHKPEESNKTQEKTLDVLNGWFNKSLDKIMSKNDGPKSPKKVIENQPTTNDLTESRSYDNNCCNKSVSQLCGKDGSSEHVNELSSQNAISSQQSTQTFSSFGHIDQLNNDLNGSFSPKRTKKYKKIRDSYTMDAYEQKSSLLYKKAKPVLKRSITKQVTSKLESILDRVWNAGVSSLIEEHLKTDQDDMRIELKIKGPIFLQAMRCKLTNHSYDTLEQALSDFHQYFLELKSRNKGDTQCEKVVGVLEKMFFDLVEKNFGPMYHFQPEFFNSDSLSNVKTRKQKKSSRKC